ncbi:dihydroorotase [Mucilaginibacter sp. PPCGB 2223]|uniref:dihydroorotase n=1 Tax=Mucilaginibacter sp. PPCGB 2223 TaxID=1886027 RepID=UPI0008240438|nr:dihydroorotase [Mucilaginibacter sp. PPCGB 2223]OCX52961.1 dihydroorotase [Mucilaginibacter sp. PPCGB 2223]
MNLLIKSATITDPNSPHHRQTADILIRNGLIADIAADIQADAEIFDAAGKHVAPGFFDLNCNIGELGLETKEDLQTGTKAAAAGGFTGLALMPNTNPPVHSKSEVEFILNKAKGNLVDIYPLGTISHKSEGKDLAEMFDMHQSGAKAFTDGRYPVQDAGLMERALLYAQGFDGLVFSYPEDRAIAGKAKVHEGDVSTILGMKGIPALAEELMIARDLYLVGYTGSKIHFSTVSTRQSVELIRQAKQKGLNVTCDVAAHHLVLTHEALMGFDSHYKVKPPLRTADDVKALIEGLEDGTIDAIVSQHTPHEVEFKAVEFEVAEYGMIALQTVLPLVLRAGLAVDVLVNKLAIAPRRILGVDAAVIEKDKPANLVVFDTKQQWNFTKQNNLSKSYNSPFIDEQLTGRVTLACNNKQVFKP